MVRKTRPKSASYSELHNVELKTSRGRPAQQKRAQLHIMGRSTPEGAVFDCRRKPSYTFPVMRSRLKTVKAIAIAAMVVFALGAILWPRQGPLPPSVSVVLLGYTNRVGPYALLAITNHSESAITLDLRCIVKYGNARQGSAPHSITSIDANTLRAPRLCPHEGFVQGVFVFPASQSQWQFEGYASYISPWLEVRRSAENWFQKQVCRMKFPPRSKTWHTFDSEWFTCP
jgi:hypothetical protein